MNNGNWKIGNTGDSIVSDKPTKNKNEITPDIYEYYGGYLIAESISEENIKVLEVAPAMLEMLQSISSELEKIWNEDDSNIVFDLIDAEKIDKLIKKAIK